MRTMPRAPWHVHMHRREADGRGQRGSVLPLDCPGPHTPSTSVHGGSGVGRRGGEGSVVPRAALALSQRVLQNFSQRVQHLVLRAAPCPSLSPLCSPVLLCAFAQPDSVAFVGAVNAVNPRKGNYFKQAPPARRVPPPDPATAHDRGVRPPVRLDPVVAQLPVPKRREGPSPSLTWRGAKGHGWRREADSEGRRA